MVIIALEGVDCSGKSTQLELLHKYLKELNLDVVVESFPRYDTIIGRLISDGLIKGDLNYKLLHLLYEVDRYIFEDTLRECQVLLLDRYTMSNLAYGKSNGVDVEWLKVVQQYELIPDITLVLSPPSKLSERRGTPRDIFEKSDILQENAHKEYLRLAKESDFAVVIPADLTIEDTHEKIKGVVYPYLKLCIH